MAICDANESSPYFKWPHSLRVPTLLGKARVFLGLRKFITLIPVKSKHRLTHFQHTAAWRKNSHFLGEDREGGRERLARARLGTAGQGESLKPHVHNLGLLLTLLRG